MIRVAQIMGKMNGGGVEQVVLNYYRYIDRTQIQFDFVVDADSSLVPREEIEALGGKVFIVPPYQRSISNAKALQALFSREKWPIVHSHLNALSVFPLRVAEKTGVPVRIAHSHSTSGAGEHVKNAMKSVLKLFSKRYATDRFACSALAGDWLFGAGGNYHIVRNAVDLDSFRFNEQTRDQVRRDLGLSDAFVVGHVGRFVPQKNHSFLIEAFSRFSRIRQDARLVLVGDGELTTRVQREVEKLGVGDKVIFLGQRKDTSRLYQAFDVFALPSLYEGLCLVGIEAQRAGLPCLMSDQITREVDITHTVDFLPIADPDYWSREFDAPHERMTGLKDDLFLEYDIRQAANLLAQKYLSLLDRVL